MMLLSTSLSDIRDIWHGIGGGFLHRRFKNMLKLLSKKEESRVYGVSLMEQCEEFAGLESIKDSFTRGIRNYMPTSFKQ